MNPENYNADRFWIERGITYHRRFEDQSRSRRLKYWYQERRFLEYLSRISFNGILEAGCGFGRITKMIADHYPQVEIRAFDISEDQVRRARELVKRDNVSFEIKSIYDINYPERFDLVVAVELLMHIKPENISRAIEKLVQASNHHIIHVDWHDPESMTIESDSCFQHDYLRIYSEILKGFELKIIPLKNFLVNTSQALFHVAF